MDFIKKNLSFIALVIVASGALVYYMFFNGDNSLATVTSSGNPSSSSEATFLGFASELETVVFEADIFSDPRFTSLKDIRTTVVPELSGRRDPFAPLAGVTLTP